MGQNKKYTNKMLFQSTIASIIGHRTDNDEVQIYFKAQQNAQNGALRQVRAIIAMIGKL